MQYPNETGGHRPENYHSVTSVRHCDASQSRKNYRKFFTVTKTQRR